MRTKKAIEIHRLLELIVDLGYEDLKELRYNAEKLLDKKNENK